MEETFQRDEVSMSAELKLASPSAATAEVPGARREATAFQPGPRPSTAGDTPQKASRYSRQRLLRWMLFALLPLALLAGADWYVTGGQVVSTDDAYVQADTVGISTDISGIVQSVAVTDNQQVSAGQVLYRLDPKQFRIALDNAKASITQVALNNPIDEAGLSADVERRRQSASEGRPRPGDL
jgi:membrane fusion protein (multidrug efflux system)